MLQIRWFFGTVGLVGCCAALACSGTDPVQGGSSPKATGGAPASSAMGGAPAKTCGAQKVPAGCADATAALVQCKVCHDAEGVKSWNTVDFFTEPKAALLGKSALYTTINDVAVAGCPAQKEILLDPNDFDGSLFVTKTRGTGFKCGIKMPWNADFADKTRDMNCILAWACGLTQ